MEDKILIAESNIGHAALIEKNLRRFGVRNEFLKFHSSEPLLEYLNNLSGSNPVFLILDIDLIPSGGIKVLEVIVSRDDLKEIPVCITVLEDNHKAITRCNELGYRTCILKDLDSENFAQNIQKLGLFIVEKNGLLKKPSKSVEINDILKNFEDEKRKIYEAIGFNLEKAVLPIINRMKKKKRFDPNDLRALEYYIKNVSSFFPSKLLNINKALTHTEIKICMLVKEGYQDKEIGSFFDIKTSTVQTHRKSIRKKLGLVNKSLNLQSFLRSI